MPFTLRRAEVDDWPKCRDIRLRALREEPQAYASTFEREQRLTDQEWRDRLAGAITVLAVTDDELIGTATGLEQPKGDMIAVAMYVVPEARGKGYAALLIDEIAKAAVTRGGRRLILDIAEGNTAAERCYRKYGFVPTGQRVPMERDPSIVQIRYAYSLVETRRTR